MHFHPLRRVHTSRAICTLAVALAITACSDSTSSMGTPPPADDPRLIAFVSDSDNLAGNSSIFVVHADGTNRTRVTSEGFHDSSPAWSPDGSTIAFRTDRSPAGIWIVDGDGSNLRPLLTTPDVRDADAPAWSPDGRSIAFNATLEDSPNAFSAVIMIADADGLHAHRLTTNAGNVAWPSWSPDGTRIAFQGVPDLTAPHIFVIKSDGTAQQQLTFDFDIQPRWSPDGRHIAFTSLDSDAPGIVTQVWVTNADGSNRRALTSGGTFRAPTWSPDSKQLAYQGVIPDTARSNPIRIFRTNADGSDAREISSDSDGDLPVFDSLSPAWKPAP